MMRILWLADFYPPHIGGLERHIQMIARELSSRNHIVSVATVWREGTSFFEMDKGVKVYRLNGLAQRFTNLYRDPLRRFHPTFPDPLITKSLRKIIQIEKPQIVIASGWIMYSFLPIKTLAKAKLLVRHHDYAFVCPKRTLLYKDRICDGPGVYKCYACAADHYGLVKGGVINGSFKLFSHFHGLIDHHLPISHSVADAIQLTNVLPSSAIHIVPAPIPDESFEHKPMHSPPVGIPANEDYILYVGALTKHKGLDVLLDAYRGLEHRARLVLIGTEWPDSPSEYPEGVIVIKNAPHDIVMEVFSRCLFSVVPSLWAEPFGQVAVEAMASCKPVIASDHGGLTDIVLHRETGVLIQPGNSLMLHNEMINLLDNGEYRQKLGKAGYSRAKQLFTCTQVTNQIEMICKELLRSC